MRWRRQKFQVSGMVGWRTYNGIHFHLPVVKEGERLVLPIQAVPRGTSAEAVLVPVACDHGDPGADA